MTDLEKFKANRTKYARLQNLYDVLMDIYTDEPELLSVDLLPVMESTINAMKILALENSRISKTLIL